MNKKCKLILFAAAALLEILFLVWTRADFHSTLSGGSEYEVPVTIMFSDNFREKNYLPLHVPLNEAPWRENTAPKQGETVYLSIGKDKERMLLIKEATREKPEGDYIEVRALYGGNGLVYFNFPADRMYMPPDELKKLPIVEIAEQVARKDEDTEKTETYMKNRMTALIRVKDGRVVISQVLVNGGPIEKIFTTIGKSFSVKYAASGEEKDMYDEKQPLIADRRDGKTEEKKQ